MNPAQVVLNGSLIAAMPLAALAGLVSFLSPCVLPLVPGYLGYVSGMAGRPAVAATEASPNAAPNRSRMVLGSALFVLGFTAVFVTLGAGAGSLGGLFTGTAKQVIQVVLGILVFGMGLVMLGEIGWLQRNLKLSFRPRYGLWGAPLLGLVFGLGWTPCIGPTLSTVLTLAAEQQSSSRGALLAVCYAVGLGLPFIAIAAGFSVATRSVAFVKRNLRAFNLGGGALLMVLGLLLATGVWNLLVAQLQEVLSGFIPAV
jgi:cytochrome c-type biogenesis protein